MGAQLFQTDLRSSLYISLLMRHSLYIIAGMGAQLFQTDLRSSLYISPLMRHSLHIIAGIERKGKSMPFDVNLMRSQVLYRAVQALLACCGLYIVGCIL